MSTISPVVADAFSPLRMYLYGHLYEAEFLAEKGGEWSDQDRATARKLIPDLMIIIRGLLKDPHRQFVSLVRRANDGG